ncbi:MAG TPA: RNA-binding transcriptional accessory protein [Candidatus Pseudogracilibacillus intestinigallinarum]|uniref:RNA-binding transcriptional accessory protein n=1 Tax=Candidatus Pseudogracilibacillus intestinigallinarum TaxID=2838742 RepID=A0A9D1PMD6_9BACI|nr:RNA-binding transcriptional accessory protein [Candidatus Pseudogracilibacillus intestinigallinarum]
MNDQTHLMELVAKELQLKQAIVQQVIKLLDEGNTVPFIARYRKEATGGLDEVQIKDIQDHWQYAVQLAERKEEVIRLIDEQGKLTEELQKNIEAATKLQRVEDLYRPYRQKRRTRATIAKEKGLEPLAEQIFTQSIENIEAIAEQFFTEEHELSTVEDVLAGANDIIAEWISDDPTYRDYIRETTWKLGTIETAIKNAEKDEKEIFKMYYEYDEAIRSLVSHRTLAINRGEKEDVLRVKVVAPEEKIMQFLQKKVIGKVQSEDCAKLIEAAMEDSYKRLIEPSVEREIRARLTETAESQAINVFSENLRNLLLQPPLKGRVILSVDPAFRTGCKLAVVDETGKMLEVGVMFPTAPRNDVKGAEKIVLKLVEKYPIKLIAIGNGTASRETEQFIADVIDKNNLDVPYIIVNEAGASVYSASELAREEFPDLEVEERSAVSIGRRVQDPLAELVKIDPKSIGVGQYQHDVSQKELTHSLDFVVETAVNQVGVNVNTASASLLEHVAGLSKTIARNIVVAREDLGKFSNRTQLKKVPRLGPKTYEQSIGFLRVIDGANPLDMTPIHPESYDVTKALLTEVGFSLEDVGSDDVRAALAKVDLNVLAEKLDVGVPTLQDIVEALSRPGRDLRDDFPQPILKQKVLSLEDLEEGMEMEGTVRNVVDFGAFVDIGVGQDGLVHISKLANHFVKHPMDVVSVGDVVTVWVDEVDIKRGRIALTMLQEAAK